MPATYDRDLIGYGANPPDPKWPDGARLAVNFVMNYEEGSEPSVQDGEGFTEVGLTEAHGLGQGVKGRDLAGEGMFEYGSRVGFWRLMRLFQERKLPMTVFGCALALERNKPAADAIRASGFDVCCHGWRWIKHFELTEAEEREHIRQGRRRRCRRRSASGRSAGTAATGRASTRAAWSSRRAASSTTRDYYGDELPFWKTVDGRPHLIVPYSLTNNDGKYAGWVGTSDEWFAFIRDAFDMLYKEGAKTPKMMSVGLHMRLIGHPGRAAGLERLLDYIMKQDGVWVTRRLDIARHWMATHPYPGKGLNE